MTQLISIICTVKNGENTLPKTIESVIDQTFTNWELVIVDDGSTDKTTEILINYKNKDQRIKAVFTDGIGRANALNIAVRNAKGNYICNIDADDLFHPEKLKLQLESIESNPNYFLISTETHIIYDNEEPNWKKYDQINNKIKINKINHTILVKNQINHSSVIMRSEDLRALGGYDEKRKSQFDYELWLRAFLKNKKLGKIKYTLTAKRIHVNQSYENKKRIIYLYRSVVLQLNSIIKYRKRLHYILIPPIRLVLGLLPFRIRKYINKYLIK